MRAPATGLNGLSPKDQMSLFRTEPPALPLYKSIIAVCDFRYLGTSNVIYVDMRIYDVGNS